MPPLTDHFGALSFKRRLLLMLEATNLGWVLWHFWCQHSFLPELENTLLKLMNKLKLTQSIRHRPVVLPSGQLWSCPSVWELQLKWVRLLGQRRAHHSQKRLCLTFIVLANKSGCERAVFHVQLHSPGRKEAHYVQDVKILADTCMILLHLLQHKWKCSLTHTHLQHL